MDHHACGSQPSPGALEAKDVLRDIGWLTSARLRGYCKQGSLRTAVFSFAVEYGVYA